MLTIEINNSFSQVKGLTTPLMANLKKVLSYQTDPAAAFYSKGFGPRVKYLIDKRGFYPTGLTYRVLEHLNKTSVPYVISDQRAKPKLNSVKLSLPKSLKPYAWQLEATERAVKSGVGGIAACTGSGKSLVIALIASRLGVKTLVVVPTLEIQKQLKASLLELFKANAKYITVLNIDSSELQKSKGYDCLIIDECHHSAAKTYQKLNKTAWTGIYHRFFLTATFFRNQENEQLMFEGLAGKLIYELPYKKAVAEGYIVPVKAYYVDVPKSNVNGYTWAQVYNELVVNNENRNSIIKTILSLTAVSGIRTLCLVKEIAHGNKFSDLIPFVNGQDEDSRQNIERFNKGTLATIIGTTGIIGEGVDTKPCEMVIIAGLGKAKSAFMQQVGRAVRVYSGKESASVIIFKDDSHKWTKSHFKAQCKILFEEYGVVPIKLSL